MCEWVSVEDRLPCEEGNYIVFTEEYLIPTHQNINGAFYWAERGTWSKYMNQYPFTVTHWMAFPDPPEEEPPAVRIEAITFAGMRLVDGAIWAVSPEGQTYYSIDEGENYRACDEPTSEAVQAIIAYVDKLEKELPVPRSPQFIFGNKEAR